MSKQTYYISLPTSGIRLTNQPRKEAWAVLESFLKKNDDAVLIIGKHGHDDNEEVKSAIFDAVEYAERDL